MRSTSNAQVHDRHRNLVVAATGTGKTVVAALDYRRLCEAGDAAPSLLFVAHRKEILEQSLRTYREVLARPGLRRALRRRGPTRAVAACVRQRAVVDAPTAWTRSRRTPTRLSSSTSFTMRRRTTYRTHPRPPCAARTARTHGHPRTGRRRSTSASSSTVVPQPSCDCGMRLGADLLCPFHYFAVADGTDLRRISWSSGRYDETALSNVFTGNDARACSRAEAAARQGVGCRSDAGAWVLRERCACRIHGPSLQRSRHPRPGRQWPDAASASASRRLQTCAHRRVNALFAADLLNEGLDCRTSTRSSFSGRRRAPRSFFSSSVADCDAPPQGGADRIGLHRLSPQGVQFRDRFRALTGDTRRGLERQVAEGFPFLPSGCQIVLDRQAQTLVLENIRSQIANRWQQIVAELRAYGDQDLPTFLDESGLELV